MIFTDKELDAIVHVASTGSPCLDAADAITYLRNRDPIGAAIMRERALEISDNIAADWHHTDDKRGWIADTGREISDAIRALELPTHAEILSHALELPEIKARMKSAILNAQLAALETGKLYTPDEIETAALAALEPKP